MLVTSKYSVTTIAWMSGWMSGLFSPDTGNVMACYGFELTACKFAMLCSNHSGTGTPSEYLTVAHCENSNNDIGFNDWQITIATLQMSCQASYQMVANLMMASIRPVTGSDCGES